MPNHVTTICIVTGPEDGVQRFKREIFDAHDAEGKDLFDFNRIIPMPPILEDTESGIAEQGAALIIYRAERGAPFADHAEFWSKRVREDLLMQSAPISEVAKTWLTLHSEYEEAGKLRLRAILETGFASWYPWRIENWGTKWGSYDVEERLNVGDGFSFKFETAWNFPEPIFAKLVEQFPTLTFDLACFDEGWNFAGQGELGAVVQTPFEITKEAATDELYERVYGEAPEHEDA